MQKASIFAYRNLQKFNGSLFEDMRKEEFYSGLSLPRNKELMRVF